MDEASLCYRHARPHAAVPRRCQTRPMRHRRSPQGNCSEQGTRAWGPATDRPTPTNATTGGCQARYEGTQIGRSCANAVAMTMGLAARLLVLFVPLRIGAEAEAQGFLPISPCPAADPECTGTVTIHQIIIAVGNALNGCALT